MPRSNASRSRSMGGIRLRSRERDRTSRERERTSRERDRPRRRHRDRGNVSREHVGHRARQVGEVAEVGDMISRMKALISPMEQKDRQEHHEATPDRMERLASSCPPADPVAESKHRSRRTSDRDRKTRSRKDLLDSQCVVEDGRHRHRRREKDKKERKHRGDRDVNAGLDGLPNLSEPSASQHGELSAGGQKDGVAVRASIHVPGMMDPAICPSKAASKAIQHQQPPLNSQDQPPQLHPPPPGHFPKEPHHLQHPQYPPPGHHAPPPFYNQHAHRPPHPQPPHLQHPQHAPHYRPHYSSPAQHPPRPQHPPPHPQQSQHMAYQSPPPHVRHASPYGQQQPPPVPGHFPQPPEQHQQQPVPGEEPHHEQKQPALEDANAPDQKGESSDSSPSRSPAGPAEGTGKPWEAAGVPWQAPGKQPSQPAAIAPPPPGAPPPGPPGPPVGYLPGAPPGVPPGVWPGHGYPPPPIGYGYGPPVHPFGSGRQVLFDSGWPDRSRSRGRRRRSRSRSRSRMRVLGKFGRKRAKAKAKGRAGRKKPDGSSDGSSEPRKRKRCKDGRPAPEDAPTKYAEGLWEAPREHGGLNLIGEIAPSGVKWDYLFRDDSRRSYAGYLRSPLLPELCTQFFQRIRDNSDWKRPESKGLGVMPRKTCWLVRTGCTCSYRYGGIEVDPDPFPQWMMELLAITMPYCGLHNPDEWPDSCNLNLYEDGAMAVGWHTDDEQLFQGRYRDIRIISLSFGATRSFQLRLNWPEAEEKGMFTFRLNNGDLLSMEGMSQKHSMHRVPREECVSSARINLTWRWVVKHSPRCPVGRNRL